MDLTRDRRDFIKTLAAGAVAAAASPNVFAQSAPESGGQRWVGVQIGPHSLYDEGIERCLDLLQETADVNALLVYSHTYYTADDIRLKQSARRSRDGPRGTRTGHRSAKSPVRLGEAPRGILQRNGASSPCANEGPGVLRLRFLLRASGSASRPRHQALCPHSRAVPGRHLGSGSQLGPGADRGCVRAGGGGTLLEPSRLRQLVARDRRGPLPELRARRVSVGRGARRSALEPPVPGERSVLLLRSLPRPLPGQGNRRGARA